MSKIYLINNSNNNHHDVVIPKSMTLGEQDELLIAKENAPVINVYVDVQPTFFEVKMYYTEIENIAEVTNPETLEVTPATTITHTKYLVWHKLDLNTLTNINGFNDQTGWSVDDNVQTLNYTDSIPIARDLGDHDLVDVFSMTLISKPSRLTTRLSPHYKSSWSMFVPFITGADMTDFVYRLNLDEGLTYEIDPTSPAKDDIINSIVSFKDLIAPITVTQPAGLSPDSVAEVTVNTLPGIDSLWIEPIVGQVNKTKVKLVNGVGKFNIITTGLETGDTVEVKLGYKKWSNATSYKQTITYA